MIYWAQLLHFYQPPTQLHWVLDKICHESYRPLIEVFDAHPHARATVNINGTLIEMLHEHGMGDVLDGLRALAERGQIEFTGTGKYHPILPLLPEDEMDRQIALNKRTSRHFLGPTYEPRGFFPPELSYSRNIIWPVIKSGHEWMILSGIANPATWPVDTIYQVGCDEAAGCGQRRLAVFFRDDWLSNDISFQRISAGGFLSRLEQLGQGRPDTYVVTAMDAETYGHHIQGWEDRFLAEVYEELQPSRETHSGIVQAYPLAPHATSLLQAASESHQIQAVTISELLQLFPRGAIVQPLASSWSTSGEDLQAGNPYPLWLDKDNEIHHLQWQHLNLAMDMVRKAISWADNPASRRYAGIARGLLDRALHSCQFWWASRRPMWDINIVYKGLELQDATILNAYKAINSSGASGENKTEQYYRVVAARDLHNKIIDRLFMA